ncbi:MAG: hypothetical protein ACR2RD_11580 [Woeseiaceae bacterium]
MFIRFALMILILASAGVTANTEIHRCPLEDGTIAFQEMPCSEPTASSDDGSESDESISSNGTPAADDDVFDFVNPFDEPAIPQQPVATVLPERISKDRNECEKTTRDAIDAIDLEMRESTYSEEQGQEYLAELLELTRQLRACKQL